MKTKDLLTVTTVAMGTAALTIATFWAGSIDAGGEPDQLSAKIDQPKLVSQGVEVTLAAAGGQTFKAGDEPSYELKAVNTTDKKKEITIHVVMTTSAPADRMSRLAVFPAPLWQCTQELALCPNETKVVTLTSDKKLPAGQVVSVSLRPGAAPLAGRAGSPNSSIGNIVALNYTTQAPTAQGATR
jgi:hypothetical protein